MCMMNVLETPWAVIVGSGIVAFIKPGYLKLSGDAILNAIQEKNLSFNIKKKGLKENKNFIRKNNLC